MKLIMTVGISASGKTTWAETQKHCMVNINRDDIRFNIVQPGSDWSTYKFSESQIDRHPIIIVHNFNNIFVAEFVDNSLTDFNIFYFHFNLPFNLVYLNYISNQTKNVNRVYIYFTHGD